MNTDRMFATFDNSIKSTNAGGPNKTGKGKNKNVRPERLNLSAQEIRERVAKGLGKSITDKAMLSNSGKKFGDGFMDNEPVKAEAGSPAGDISKNDPNDVVTQEKLKDLVSKGGFNFSEKERQVLSGILGTKE